MVVKLSTVLINYYCQDVFIFLFLLFTYFTEKRVDYRDVRNTIFLYVIKNNIIYVLLYECFFYIFFQCFYMVFFFKLTTYLILTF